MKKLNTKRKNRSNRSFNPSAIALTVARAMTNDLGRGCTSRYTGVCPPPTAQFFVSEQSKSILKKFDDGNTKNVEVLTLNALKKFSDVNLHMRNYTYKGLNLPIYVDRPCRHSGYSLRDEILITARKICHVVLGDITTEAVFEKCKHSSGSSIGVPFEDTSWENKFALPISGTIEAVNLFRSYLEWNTSMRDALSTLWNEPRVKDKTFMRSPDSMALFNVVSWSRATTVEKDAKNRRFIAKEPTLNMFFQQGLMLLFYDCLAGFGLDLSTAQELHKKLARRASLTGLQATIDWSSASDCVSTDYCEWSLPRKWFEWMNAMRTGFVSIRDDDVVPCSMFATMGNATTFPLETLVFWSIAIATVQCSRNRGLNRVTTIPDFRIASNHEVSVFGDDCIVPSESADTFISVCTSVGFIINESKSFFSPTAGFRESCGGDYYHGTDVRPLFVRAPTDRKLASLEPWLYTIMNRALQKYKLYFGSLSYVYGMELWKELANVFDRYKLKVKLVPSYFPEDSGLLEAHDFMRLIPYGFKLDKLKIGNYGTIGFRYCSYKYPEKTDANEHLTYSRKLLTGYQKWTPLKQVRREVLEGNPIRKMGYYQVVRGLTSCWSLPSVGGV